MEFLVVISFFAYLYYLRNYADLRSKSEKEAASLTEGINLYNTGQFALAFDYFDKKIKANPKSTYAYLYRGLCFKSKGDMAAARKDIIAGLGYDGTVALLHFEKGKLELEMDNPSEALISFNKAISYDGDQHESFYHWRGKTRQKMGMDADAQNDFLKEGDILRAKLAAGPATQKPKEPFFDKRLAINSVLIFATSALIIYIVKKSDGIHLPYLLAVISAVSIGFVEPVKGWILAIFQSILIISGYFIFTQIPESAGRQEIENFGIYGSCILTFAASFIGGFLKRAINAG